jgi:hypothetical protein
MGAESPVRPGWLSPQDPGVPPPVPGNKPPSGPKVRFAEAPATPSYASKAKAGAAKTGTNEKEFQTVLQGKPKPQPEAAAKPTFSAVPAEQYIVQIPKSDTRFTAKVTPPNAWFSKVNDRIMSTPTTKGLVLVALNYTHTTNVAITFMPGTSEALVVKYIPVILAGLELDKNTPVHPTKGVVKFVVTGVPTNDVARAEQEDLAEAIYSDKDYTKSMTCSNPHIFGWDKSCGQLGAPVIFPALWLMPRNAKVDCNRPSMFTFITRDNGAKAVENYITQCGL